MPAKRSHKDVKGAWRAQYKKKSFKRKAGAARVKGAIVPRKEFKFVDVVSASYAPNSAAGTITLLNGIAQGDDYTSRDGRQATMKSVHVRGYVKATNASASVSAYLMRALLVWDNAPNGAAATVAQIMTAETSVSFPLIDNANRFTILRDQQFNIGSLSSLATASWAAGDCSAEVDMYVKLDELTQFSGTGATIASIQNGALWLVLQSDYNNVGNPQFTLTSRVRFCEM